MSERIQVKRDGEHRGWVHFVGVNMLADEIGFTCLEEWRAERPNGHFWTFTSRDAAIRWLVEEETA